nr:hypothetical protein [Priestia abyssalis]
MAKSNRGHSLYKLPSKGRGTCPVCSRTRIKLLYPASKSDGQKFKICKRCRNASQERIDAANI